MASRSAVQQFPASQDQLVTCLPVNTAFKQPIRYKGEEFFGVNVAVLASNPQRLKEPSANAADGDTTTLLDIQPRAAKATSRRRIDGRIAKTGCTRGLNPLMTKYTVKNLKTILGNYCAPTDQAENVTVTGNTDAGPSEQNTTNKADGVFQPHGEAVLMQRHEVATPAVRRAKGARGMQQRATLKYVIESIEIGHFLINARNDDDCLNAKDAIKVNFNKRQFLYEFSCVFENRSTLGLVTMKFDFEDILGMCFEPKAFFIRLSKAPVQTMAEYFVDSNTVNDFQLCDPFSDVDITNGHAAVNMVHKINLKRKSGSNLQHALLDADRVFFTPRMMDFATLFAIRTPITATTATVDPAVLLPPPNWMNKNHKQTEEQNNAQWETGGEVSGDEVSEADKSTWIYDEITNRYILQEEPTTSGSHRQFIP